MWLATDFGFFSVVQKDGEKLLTVRACVLGDLEALRHYCPELGPTITTPLADYGYRAHVSHKAWGEALAKIGQAVDYHNFKDSVAERQGIERAAIYSRVWTDLLELAGLDKPLRKATRRK